MAVEGAVERKIRREGSHKHGAIVQAHESLRQQLKKINEKYVNTIWRR